MKESSFAEAIERIEKLEKALEDKDNTIYALQREVYKLRSQLSMMQQFILASNYSQLKEMSWMSSCTTDAATHKQLAN